MLEKCFIFLYIYCMQNPAKMVTRKSLTLLERFLLKRGLIFASTIIGKGAQSTIDLSDRLNYFRYAMLQLVANEIHSKKLVGNLAEVGVYEGRFAVKVNELFPDRKFYLFDTFKGFDERDATLDQKKGFSLSVEGGWKTNAEAVLQKMKYPNNVVIKKGWFPETGKGLEAERFVFVSLDADLYEPTYQGLKFFYEKLVPGGYIFIDDYNNTKTYRGVGEAVRNFCAENKSAYMPIPDGYGSVVLAK
jgi:O-methyltransferase